MPTPSLASSGDVALTAYSGGLRFAIKPHDELQLDPAYRQSCDGCTEEHRRILEMTGHSGVSRGVT
jgi:hypothetical protein